LYSSALAMDIHQKQMKAPQALEV